MSSIDEEFAHAPRISSATNRSEIPSQQLEYLAPSLPYMYPFGRLHLEYAGSSVVHLRTLKGVEVAPCGLGQCR